MLFEVVPANCRQTIIDIVAPVQMSHEDTERDTDPSAIGGASNEAQQITEELKEANVSDRDAKSNPIYESGQLISSADSTDTTELHSTGTGRCTSQSFVNSLLCNIIRMNVISMTLTHP